MRLTFCQGGVPRRSALLNAVSAAAASGHSGQGLLQEVPRSVVPYTILSTFLVRHQRRLGPQAASDFAISAAFHGRPITQHRMG